MKRFLPLLLLLGLAHAQMTGSGGVMLSGAVQTSASGAHSVALTWGQSTSPNIASNRVYRGTTSGGETAYYTCAAPCTAYTDTQVTAGLTYYYTVTATNASGTESGMSNEFKAVIP